MSSDKDRVQEFFNELIKQLIIMSLKGKSQIEYFGLLNAGDELALDFDNFYSLKKEEYIFHNLLDQQQIKKLDELNEFLDERSGGKNANFWNNVETHEDWGKVRLLARECLRLLNKQGLGIKVKFNGEKTYFDNQEVWHSHGTKTELVLKPFTELN